MIKVNFKVQYYLEGDLSQKQIYLIRQSYIERLKTEKMSTFV